MINQSQLVKKFEKTKTEVYFAIKPYARKDSYQRQIFRIETYVIPNLFLTLITQSASILKFILEKNYLLNPYSTQWFVLTSGLCPHQAII
jgi:hypothetical protein